MSDFIYCQSEIEEGKRCKTQCDHCKSYYAPLEDHYRYFLPHDIARCNRDDCPLHLECARCWIDCRWKSIGTVSLSRSGARILLRRNKNLKRGRNKHTKIMIKTSIENLADPIGFDIGNSDNVVQGNLLNGFCRGLYNSIPDKFDRKKQYSYIVDKLDAMAMDVLSEIVEFIKPRQSGL